MQYTTDIRTDDAKVILSIAEFANTYELAKRHAKAELTPTKALALAAELIHAANDVLERELERGRPANGC